MNTRRILEVTFVVTLVVLAAFAPIVSATPGDPPQRSAETAPSFPRSTSDHSARPTSYHSTRPTSYHSTPACPPARQGSAHGHHHFHGGWHLDPRHADRPCTSHS